jgi:hypothetical protein
MLLPRRLHRFTPSPTDSIDIWWSNISDAVPRKDRKELNALVILIARCLWLERNSRVFEKFASMSSEVCRKIRAEFDQWKRANLCGVLGEIE